jgi:hypothetical protein
VTPEERLAAIRERRAGERSVRAEFAGRRARGVEARHLAKLTRDTESSDALIVSATDNLTTMDRDGGPVAVVEVTGIARATLAKEAARSVRRSAACRNALAARDLAPWLATVDQRWPGLVETERLRLAGILRRQLADSSVRSP